MHSINPNNARVHIVCMTGRQLNRKLRDATASDRALIADDLRSGTLVVTDLTTQQARHLVAASLVVAFRHVPDEVDQAIERLGVDRIWRALDKFTAPMREAAE
jgi:hypothetical protein